MTGAVCPSCGVAVLPGYVRCPKCKKALPRRHATPVEGGTAVQTTRRGPWLAVVGLALIGLALLIYFGLRTPKASHAQAAPAPVENTPAQPAENAASPEAPEATAAAAPAGPSAVDVAANLEKALKKAHLWSTVGVVGDHVDVRSGSCSDPGIAPLLDGAAPSFKAAGLTRMRCLEQSGRVVTDRDL